MSSLHSEYHRKLINFLREYGAKNISLSRSGTKHPRLLFEFRQKPYNVVVHTSVPASHIDAAQHKISELKSMLGDPIVTTTTPRKLEDMAPKVNSLYKTPNQLYIEGNHTIQGFNKLQQSDFGEMALYQKSNGIKRIRFYIPDQILKQINYNNEGLILSKFDAITWELQINHHPSRKFPTVRSIPDGNCIEFNDHPILNDINPFGKSRAEYLIVDKTILVILQSEDIKEVRKVVITKKRVPKKLGGEDATLLVIDEPGTIIQKAWEQLKPSNSLPPVVSYQQIDFMLMQDLVNNITRIEKETQFKLTKLKDKGWVFLIQSESSS